MPNLVLSHGMFETLVFYDIESRGQIGSCGILNLCRTVIFCHVAILNLIPRSNMTNVIAPGELQNIQYYGQWFCPGGLGS
jgi:hypothetical protein